METNLHAESFEHDEWEEKQEISHEIKVDNVEVNEDDDFQKSEVKIKRDGPAWKIDDESEVKATVTPVKQTFAQKYRSVKLAPQTDIQSFPDINSSVSNIHSIDEG